MNGPNERVCQCVSRCVCVYVDRTNINETRPLSTPEKEKNNNNIRKYNKMNKIAISCHCHPPSRRRVGNTAENRPV